MYINLQIYPEEILQGQLKRESNLLNLQLKHPALASNHVIIHEDLVMFMA